MEKLKASVIVPCGRPERARPTLNSLFNQKSDLAYEVIIVGKGVANLLKDYPELKALDFPEPLSPAQARNRGAEMARGELLLFLDDDCEAPPDWIDRNVAELQRRPDAGAIGARIRGKSNAFFARCTDYCNFSLQLSRRRHENVRGLYAASLGIRKDLFAELGGFDETLRVREDVDLVHRARALGKPSVYEPSIEIRHDHRRDTLRKLLAYERTNGRLAGLLEETKNPHSLSSAWRLRIRKVYALFALPFAAAQTLQTCLRNLRSAPGIVLMSPFIFLGYSAYHFGVSESLKCQ